MDPRAAGRAGAFTGAIVADGAVDDRTFPEVRDFSHREVVELAMTADLYLMLARIMTAQRINPTHPSVAVWCSSYPI